MQKFCNITWPSTRFQISSGTEVVKNDGTVGKEGNVGNVGSVGSVGSVSNRDVVVVVVGKSVVIGVVVNGVVVIRIVVILVVVIVEVGVMVDSVGTIKYYTVYITSKFLSNHFSNKIQ